MSSYLIAKMIVAIPFGVVISLFVTPVLVFIRKMFFGPSSNEKLVKRAREKGNIVQAKLVKNYDIRGEQYRPRNCL